ncbi:MAG: SPOR domain-containing protein [Gammaproteobacteria bacterium]|nr:SPOR domain-containing protein [Gammaproteobacteria bacterium]
MDWWARPTQVLAAALVLHAAAASAQTTRLLAGSGVTARDDHVDLALDFTCTLRYQTHSPASEGDELRVRLAIGPDCQLPPSAQFAVERLLTGDAVGLVRSIELQPGLAGGAELIVRWNRIEKYVLAPSTGMRGLRIRVQRTGAASRVVVGDELQKPGGFAVNLESSQEKFSDMAVAKAAALLRTPVFVSQRDVDGVTWFRLRAGPFDTRREADAALRAARSSYPTAWLGIDDEVEPTTPDAGSEVITRAANPARAAETRADAALDARLEEARSALSAKRFDDAITRLTQIVAAEDYLHRIEAAELLGLARERKGQLAQAKATYEDYLRRYPDSPAAARIRSRLQTLRTASLPGRRGTGGGDGATGWSAYGSASQVYRRDDMRLSSAALSRNLTTQNAMLTDVDGLVRRRGERLDFTSRISMGYIKDLMQTGRGDQLRVSSAYVELNDRELGLGTRLGRQSRGMAGISGAFDGLLANWQWRDNIGFSASAGMPVESTRNGIATNRQFVALGADFANTSRSWDTAVYVLGQQYSGEIDRRSVGLESRYIRPGRTLVAMADYDLYFGDLNSVAVLGTLITDSRWTFNFDASRQRSPMLSIRNALIGQPTVAFDDLFVQFTPDEIDQLAADRSASLTQFGLTASHPLGDRGQWTVNLLSSNLSSTPASGGVEAVPSLGRDDALTTELMWNSLLRAGDTQSLALRYQRGGTGTLMSAGIGSRLPLGAELRLTTRIRADRRTDMPDSGSEWVYVPSLRLDWLHGRSSIEAEAGAELGSRSLPTTSERRTRYFFSLGYRLSLDTRR